MNDGDNQLLFLPTGWTTAVDPASGRTYYACPSTGESRWDLPPQNGPSHLSNNTYQSSTFPVQYELEQPQYQQTTLQGTSYHNPQYAANPQINWNHGQQHQQPQYQQQLAVNVYKNQKRVTINPFHPQHQQELNNYTLQQVQTTQEFLPGEINTIYHLQANNRLPLATGIGQPEVPVGGELGSLLPYFTATTNQRTNPTHFDQPKIRHQKNPGTSSSSVTGSSEGLFVAQARALVDQLKDLREKDDASRIISVENTQQPSYEEKSMSMELSAFTAGQLADLHSVQQQYNIEQQSRNNGDGTNNNENDNMNPTTLDFYYKPIDPFQLDIHSKRDYLEPGRIETRLHTLLEKLKNTS